MTYLGNATLPPEIQERVLSTFEQTLGLAEKGQREEARLGCEFILRLDPGFEPARRLEDRLGAGDGSVYTADLRAGDDFDLSAALRDLQEKRDLESLVRLAREHRQTVAADPELAALESSARARLEAEPYLRSFLEAGQRLEADGRSEEAEAQFRKAFELDPDHPDLSHLAERFAPGSTPGPGREEGEEREGEDGGEQDGRIQELLDEGQEAFDLGDHQAAIDSWSRIFLIDIDHEEADRRIEEARVLRTEAERKVEEAFHEAEAFLQLGQRDKARHAFESVLAIAPGNAEARERLSQLEEASDAPLEGEPAEIFTPPDPSPEKQREAKPDTPPPPTEPSKGAAKPPREAPRLLSPTFLGISGVVLLLTLAGAWLLFSRWEGLFPNSAVEEAAPEPPPRIDPIARARALHDKGDTPRAVAQLRALAPEDPAYSEAQSLIAQWETASEEKEAPPEPTAQDLADRRSLILQAQEAFSQGENLRVVELLSQAAAIAPLGDSASALLEESNRRLQGLEKQMELFRQGDWNFALPALWRLHEANPEDRDVRRLIVDSYYNLGVRDLQRGDPEAAAEKFSEALALSPEDAELQRLVDFSATYAHRGSDLLYRIFVKYLPFR